MEQKVFWKSKTLWVNLIIAGVAFFPAVKESVSPDVVIQIVAGVNLLLRLVTKGSVVLS